MYYPPFLPRGTRKRCLVCIFRRFCVYKYNIEKEDGWNYFRLGVRCRVWDNIYLQTTVKTHLSKAEMIEWGIGYQIPFKKKENRNSLFNDSSGWEIYHH